MREAGRLKMKEIAKPRLLLVEGKDEENVFSKIVEDLQVSDLQVHSYDGINNLRRAISGLRGMNGFRLLRSVGIVRDAENDADAAFQSICSSLRDAGFPVPQGPRVPARGQVRLNPDSEVEIATTVMIIPEGRKTGMLEHLLLDSVADDPAMVCIEEFFRCLKERMPDYRDVHQSKAKVRAFLVSRELMEQGHFDYIQEHIEQWIPSMPRVPSVEKLHAFLASRYNPDLKVGAAIGTYFDVRHQALDSLRNFLQSL